MQLKKKREIIINANIFVIKQGKLRNGNDETHSYFHEKNVSGGAAVKVLKTKTKNFYSKLEMTLDCD